MDDISCSRMLELSKIVRGYIHKAQTFKALRIPLPSLVSLRWVPIMSLAFFYCTSRMPPSPSSRPLSYLFASTPFRLLVQAPQINESMTWEALQLFMRGNSLRAGMTSSRHGSGRTAIRCLDSISSRFSSPSIPLFVFLIPQNCLQHSVIVLSGLQARKVFFNEQSFDFIRGYETIVGSFPDLSDLSVETDGGDRNSELVKRLHATLGKERMEDRMSKPNTVL